MIGLKDWLKKLYRKIKPVRDVGSNNSCILKSKIGTNFTITFFGKNNIVEIGERCSLTNTQILISGDNNHLIIEDTARFMGPCKIVMEGNSTVLFKKNCGIRGVEICAKNGNIEIGELTMTSYGIVIRNHDSHKVLDLDGKVLNHPKNVKIGSHVWIGQNASILKGVEIGNDCIIGFGSVVTKGCPNNSILAGNPARIVKQGITWDY